MNQDVYNYMLSILKGSILTLEVAIGSLVVAVVLGLIGASCKLSHNKLLAGLAGLYSTVIRGIPDLVSMFLIFYGGQMSLNYGLEQAWEWARQAGNEAMAARFESWGLPEYWEINPFIAGVFTIGFVYGSYMTETFRGAIMAIPKGQMEAGYAFGMSKYRVFFRITIPQMIRLAIPGFTNNWLVLTKATALVSVIGLADMTYVGRQASAALRGTVPGAGLWVFLFIALIYLAITTVSLYGLKLLDRKYSLGVRRGEF